MRGQPVQQHTRRFARAVVVLKIAGVLKQQAEEYSVGRSAFRE